MKMLINVKELNEVCAKPDKKWTTTTHFNLTNRELVHEVFRYQKFQDDFAENILYVSNGKEFIGTFRPSYEEFLKTLIETLNLKLPRGYRDNNELTKMLMERVEVLRYIQNPEELHNEFPLLYDTLKQAREYDKEIKEYKDNPLYEDIGKEESNYFYSCGLRAGGYRKGFDGFVPVQAEIYNRFINRRDKYNELTSKYSYDDFIKDNYDIDKLAMYIAYQHLLSVGVAFNSKKKLGSHIKALDKYISSTFNKQTYIKVGNKIINYNDIIEGINELKERYKKLAGEVPWVLIPEGESHKHVRRGTPGLPHVLTSEELEALKSAGEEKENFYDKNKPLLKVYGIKQYEGYLAYIYPNGEVLLDTVYDELYPQEVKGNAIYHIPARYFEMTSVLDKQALRKHPASKRIIHAGAWQQRAQKVIDQEGTQEEQEQAKQLVKRIIEENEKDK